jgi:glycosyltransferase involved in cell wall biosynthesis
MSLPRITFLVHGRPESIEAIRARGLAQATPSECVRFLFRDPDRRRTARAWAEDLDRHPPDLVYVLNTAMPGAPLIAWRRINGGVPYLLDTGDVIFEMARRSGVGAGWRLPILWAVERFAWRQASRIVVRGTRHRDYLTQRGYPSVLLRDGYSPAQDVDPESVRNLSHRLGLAGRFVVGLLGSLVWSPRLRLCYGWDLIRALPLLADLPVTALIIGDGSGLDWLKSEAQRLGVLDRIVFTGRIPYADVPVFLRTFDVALSTQTNNLPGQVRTTGKLPEYMAASRFILASKVGEAELLLPPGMLIPYEGEVDLQYPARLANRIRSLMTDPHQLAQARTLPGIAATYCSYPVLSREWIRIVNAALLHPHPTNRPGNPPQIPEPTSV